MQRRRFSASLGLLAAAVSTGNMPVGASQRAQDSTATAVVALRHYLARIAALDRSGPQLRSIIELNPDAATIARTLDAQRRAGHVRGPLHGSIVVVKDRKSVV